MTPHPLGSIKFVEGGEIYITIHHVDLRGLSLPQHGATDIEKICHLPADKANKINGVEEKSKMNVD